jgi:hypothetical protein
MDLSNTISEFRLVVLKEGVSTFNDAFSGTEFKPHTFYRARVLTNENQKEVLIYGEIFVDEDFDNKFEYASERLMRDFKLCGLVKPNGKPVSKAKFKRDCQLHTYGRGQQKLFKALFFTMKDRQIYSFQTNLRENKTEFFQETYNQYLDIMDGDLEPIDNRLVQFGNCGIPLTYSDMKVRDMSKDKPFIL